MTFLKTLFKSASTAAVAVAGVLAFAGTASADTVVYSTRGGFNGATPTAGGSSVTSTSFGNGTLLFTGRDNFAYDPATASMFSANFGTFTYAGSPSLTPAGQTFTLGVFQSQPGEGQGTLTGTITGSFITGTGASSTEITFAPNTFNITAGGLSNTYTVLTPSNIPGDLIGDITQTAVPSPSVAAGGVLLIGGTLLRRRRGSLA